MASHLDLEEQEQLANLKHFWTRYGNLISWLLIVVLGTYAAFNGWQYWQRKSAQEAAALYEELERAVQAADADRIQRVWADVQDKAGRAQQGQQAGLLAARALHEAGKLDEARKALAWVADKSGDDALVTVARLRQASLALEAKDPEQALKALDFKPAPGFEPLQADRRGDVLLAQGQHDAARSEYQKAWNGLAGEPEYRRIVESKLNALGIDPQPDASTPKQ
ncbi:MAG: hypothetical protein RLZZ555_1322 [Pseudomonadota bacterium]|jgi:predicted negative regulator of RcsB-dependent stress response